MDETLTFSNVGKVLSNGTGTAVATDDGLGNAFWDGDDMSLEMVTDVNDGDVDEEVNKLFSLHFDRIYPPSTL